jgi:hypothetical protein
MRLVEQRDLLYLKYVHVPVNFGKFSQVMFTKYCHVIISGISLVVSNRLLVVKAQVQSRMNLCQIRGGRNGT